MREALTFEAPARLPDGRMIRRASFVRTSTVCSTTACEVGKAIVERLNELLGRHISAEVTEPIAIPEATRTRLFSDAHVLRARGASCDAFIVLQRTDERELVRASFAGLVTGMERSLSKIERRVAERLCHAASLGCVPFCGAIQTVAEESVHRVVAEARDYFEIRIVAPVQARIGIAIPAVPLPQHNATIAIDEIADISLAASVSVGKGRLTVGNLARLRSGSIIPFDVPLEESATLSVKGRRVARGCAGMVNGRFAFRVAESVVPQPT